MLCVIPFFAGDVAQAQRLLRWIGDLGGCPGHCCLLVSDRDVPWTEGVKCRDLAGDCFLATDLITNEEHVEGWIPGSNSLFKAAAQWAQDHGQSFLFLEPDAVPLVSGWLNLIEAEADKMENCGHFVGSLVHHANPEWPNPYFEGVGVYPPWSWRLLSPHFNPNVSWTRACAPASVPGAVNSPLFQHLWGEVNNPPTFARKNIPGTNVFCLEQIHTGAVLFHRNKDGSLIRLLRAQRGLKPEVMTELVVLLPFCHMDYPLMLKSLEWMGQMSGPLPRTGVLHYDGTVGTSSVSRIQAAAVRAFQKIVMHPYPIPRPPYIGWPAAPNWTFKQACNWMFQRPGQSWLWFEADAVALKSDWLYQLEAEYDLGGLPFMGPIIGDFDGLKMGHMNGGGIYPWNTATVIAKGLSFPGQAWDTRMKPEMIHLCHPANHLMQHCGAVVNGCCKPANGPLAKFPTGREVKGLIHPSSVYFHPCKDGSLVDRLREGHRP